MKNKQILNLVIAGFCLAVAMVLPLLTGNVPTIGNMLCPMHIPVLLCGFLCGWQWGLAVGLIAPILRSFIFGMPPLYPNALGMMFELAVYGLVAGLMYQKLAKKPVNVYITLIAAMICGRIVWGIARFAMFGLVGTEFSFKAFISGAVLTAWPGIILHILIIPPIVIAVEKALKGKELS